MATRNPKLREAMLYVAQRCEDAPSFGKTKLFKILFYADFEAYRRWRRSITQAQYVKGPYGPLPDEADVEIATLVDAGAAVIQEVSHQVHPGLTESRLRLRHHPDAKLLSQEERALMDEYVQKFWDQSAGELSDLSHDFLGWRAAPMGGNIVYPTIFIDAPPLTESDEEYARNLVESGR